MTSPFCTVLMGVSGVFGVSSGVLPSKRMMRQEFSFVKTFWLGSGVRLARPLSGEEVQEYWPIKARFAGDILATSEVTVPFEGEML